MRRASRFHTLSNLPRLETVLFGAYVLCIFAGSYLAVSTLKSLWLEGRQLEQLASLSIDDDRYKTLVFDEIEPASGHQR